MKKYARWNAILSIPASVILVTIGAWVFVNSSDKRDANGYFIAGILVLAFGVVWFLVDRRQNKLTSNS